MNEKTDVVLMEEYKKIYKLINKNVSEQKYKLNFYNLVYIRELKVKNKKNEAKLFLRAGKVFAILTALDVTEVFFKGIERKNLNLVINFSFISTNKTKVNYDYNIVNSLYICNEILDCLCYREEHLYNKNTCNEFIKCIKSGWKSYSCLFMYSYKKTYRLINSNKSIFSSIVNGQFYMKHKIANNVYRFNKLDLNFKSSIIEMQFDERKNKSFKLQPKTIGESLDENNMLNKIEWISDMITKESILGINSSRICRSWISYKIYDNNEIKFGVLDFNYISGVIGIAYFYLRLFEVTQNKYYFKLARESMNGYYDKENSNKNEIIYALKYMYELSGDKECKNIYMYNDLTDKEIKDEELKFKNSVQYSELLLKNNLGKYFLGVDRGLAGYGLYMIDKYLKIKNNLLIISKH